ncbi:C-C motif chemokine 19a.1 [Brachyhypopomus gauderio]|uniref:C-C motif chemokine 19a.1 n=1 Tax=Brachyhypopomus gauderio TaxID=698409 RepID=UPI0040417212
MASLCSPNITLALGLAVLLSSALEVCLGDHALDCCLKVSHSPIPRGIISNYHEQVKGEGCSINAIVFLTKKGRNLCAPPEDDWAKELKNFLDARQKKCLKNKGKHCQGKKSKSV